MTNYLIVVPRGNDELFDLLSVAFRGHAGFRVVVDRRAAESSAGPERRASRATLGPDEIVVAEGTDHADRPDPGEEGPRIHQRVPVRRRRVRAARLHAASADGRAASAACASAC
jgi:hypothetical protein